MKESYRHHVERSRAHLLKGEVGLAIEALREALADNMEDPFLWEEIYKLSMLGGHGHNALVSAFKLRELDGNNPNYVYMHGMASLIAGQIEEAAQILEDALRRVPGSAEVRRPLAQAYELLGNKARAVELLEEAVQLDPTEPGPANDLATHYLAEGAEGKAKAERLLRPVLRAHPEELSAHLNMALALAERDPATARGHARKALKATEEDVRGQAQRLLELLG